LDHVRQEAAFIRSTYCHSGLPDCVVIPTGSVKPFVMWGR